MDAEKYDSRAWRDLANLFSGVKAAHDGHSQIKNHRIGTKLQDFGDCFNTVLRLTADLPLIAAGKQDAHTHAHNFVIIRN